MNFCLQKKRSFIVVLVFVVILMHINVWARGHEQELSKLWQEVDQAQKDGLPKTAIEHLKKIMPLAIKAERYGEALRALCKQLVFEANIQGNKPEEKIKRLHEEMDKAPKKLQTLIKLVLARWYWHYYQRNRWRFAQRKATDDMSDIDFTTWDLPRLFDKIDSLYMEVLSDERELKKISMESYRDFFEQGNVSVSHRPTLFDFAAFSAISFYQDGDQIRKKPEDEFELSADSDAFAPVNIFIKYSPETTDTSSPKLKALNLYQKLLAFHLKDKNKNALVDADINRLIFVKAHAFGEQKTARYIKRLSDIIDNYTSLPLSSLACYYWAEELYSNQDKYIEAHEIAEKGVRLNYDSVGAKKCRFLLSKIEAKEMDLHSEYSITPSASEVRLDYRNIDKIYFRIVDDQWDEFLKIEWGNPSSYHVDKSKFKQLLEKMPVKSWSLSLPATEDYKTRSHEIELPALKPGYYRLIASWRDDFSHAENAMKVVSFWVTNIAIIMRNTDNKIEGFVLDAITGEPIKDAEVRIYHRNKKHYFKEAERKYTDKDGFFDISPFLNIFPRYNRSIALYARYKDNELLYPDAFNQSDRYHPRDKNDQTVFFTDRAIYRPGQLIHFKVLAIKSRLSRDTYEFLPRKTLTVILKDHNYQEVERIQLTTNRFGSASGTFTAPTGKLTGTMTLLCDHLEGSTHIRVEEYKRPKFKVTLDSPKEEWRLNELVKCSGLAMAYTGAPIDGAKIAYRVTREIRYPYWCWWYNYQSSSPREIIHGKSKTDEKGSFDISFIAKPDLAVPEEDEPVFVFRVSVDVTDSSGETRSTEQRIQIGYSSMSLHVSASEWLTSKEPSQISITANTLNGELVQARGKITVFKLQQPQLPARTSLLSPLPGDSHKKVDLSDWKTWEQGEQVDNKRFDTTEGPAEISFRLVPGVYKVVATALDRYGKKIKGIMPIMVIDPDEKIFNIAIPDLLTIKSAYLEPGDNLEAIWGTGYKKGRAFVEIEHKGKIVKKYWTNPKRTQQHINCQINEEHRGGFYLHITNIKSNRAYISSRRISVPWSNKRLELKFSSFRSKLEPGSEETWSINIKGPKAEHVAAELVATLYDVSLDAFYPHSWPGLEHVFRQDYSQHTANFANRGFSGGYMVNTWEPVITDYERTYCQFSPDILNDFFQYAFPSTHYRSYAPMKSCLTREGKGKHKLGICDKSEEVLMEAPLEQFGETDDEASIKIKKIAKRSEAKTEADLSQVSVRKNLNETAFFFPDLITDKQGNVSIKFTMPEALTEWKFMGFAHAKNLLWGMLTGKTITQKDLMVQPNPPRFLREGDELDFTAKITNMSENEQSGTIRLTLTDAMKGISIDNDFSNVETDQTFSIPAKRSRSFSWKLTVPNYTGLLTYKVIASSGELSDGEENVLPVLSKRIFITESMPLPIRGIQTKSFEFKKLLDSEQSSTLVHKALTVQMVSNPAWYAVQALPYLMEFPHACSEQVFNRLYANAFARHIANSDPKIKQIFAQWRGTEALRSNLEKNEELKSVVLDETPWVIAAQDEAKAKRRIGLLFDDNHIEHALSKAYNELEKMQDADGYWPWFPGGYPNPYITLYIMTGFGRLRHLNIDVNQDLAIKSLNYLDNWIKDKYEDLKQGEKLNENNLTSIIALYLYGRSFFLDVKAIPTNCKEAVNYFLGLAPEHWLSLTSRLSQGHLALACNRFGDLQTAQKIIASLRERAVKDEEMGMFWRELELSWWWYKAPIDTQALMIEAFDEVAQDSEAVEDLKVWLLKQKQTQNWKTTKATAEAIYALLLRGTNLLASDELVQVTLGNTEIKPDKVEAGTGFYEKKFVEQEVKPEYGQVTVQKVDEGVAWGSLHWQYMEDMSKVTPYETPLHLEKKLFVKRETKKGPVIKPLKKYKLSVGDLVIVRVTLRVDRDMEYIHMKDYRGSGTEPVNVLSRYKYQDGLAYYEATKDVSTHFFIDYLPKGTYVFEYPVRIQHKGKYQMGIASIQCMYAPEFNSHSASEFITVE